MRTRRGLIGSHNFPQREIADPSSSNHQGGDADTNRNLERRNEPNMIVGMNKQ